MPRIDGENVQPDFIVDHSHGAGLAGAPIFTATGKWTEPTPVAELPHTVTTWAGPGPETPPGGSTDSEPAPHGRGVANDSTRDEGRPRLTLNISLHTADPRAGGNQTTSETVYTGYARQAVDARGA